MTSSSLKLRPLLAALGVASAALLTLLDVGCALQHASRPEPPPAACSLTLRAERAGRLPMEVTVSSTTAPFAVERLFACPADEPRARELWHLLVAERVARICEGTAGSEADRTLLCGGGATLCRVGGDRCTANTRLPALSSCTADPMPAVMALPICSMMTPPGAPVLRVFNTGDATETAVTAVNFATVLVGLADRRSLTVKNVGGGELVIRPQSANLPSMPTTIAPDFFLEASGVAPCAARDMREINRGGRVLPAGETCTVDLRFEPAFGSLPMMPKRAELQIPYNDGMDRILKPAVALSGEAISGQVTIQPMDRTAGGVVGANLCFNVLPTMVGAERCWERPLRVSASTARVRLRQITAPAGFTVTPLIGPAGLQPQLPAGGSQRVTVRFCAPPPAEPPMGTLVVNTNVVPQATYPVQVLPPSSGCTALPLP